MTFLNFTIPSWSPLIAYNSGGEGAWLEVPTNDTSGTPSQDLISFAAIGLHANATLNFTGTSITIFGSKGPLSGDFIVQLDDGPAMTENAHADGLSQAPLWSAQKLNNSEHTFKVTNHHSPQGIGFVLDSITVGRELGPPGYTGPIFNTTFDDTSSSIAYNGPWTSATSSAGFNNTLHSTNEAGSSLSLQFRGSSIELYGINADAEYEVQVDGQVTSIGPGKNTVFFNQSHQTPRTVLFYMDGLDENSTHAVVLANSNSDPNNPLYFDYAIVRSSQNSFIKTSSTIGIIVGSVLGSVGLMAICLVALFCLHRGRRRRRSKPIVMSPYESDRHDMTSILEPVIPSVYTRRKPETTQVPVSRPVGMHNIQVSTLFTGMQVAEPSPRSYQSTSETDDSRLARARTAPLQENSPSWISRNTGINTGAVVVNHLPPVYDSDWQGAS